MKTMIQNRRSLALSSRSYYHQSRTLNHSANSPEVAYSAKAANAPRPASIDPARTFPAPELGADFPVGLAIGLPVPAAEEETKEADAEAVTFVGNEVFDVFRDAGMVMFLVGWRTVMVCGRPVPLGTGMGRWVVRIITEELVTGVVGTMAEVVVVFATTGMEIVVVA